MLASRTSGPGSPPRTEAALAAAGPPRPSMTVATLVPIVIAVVVAPSTVIAAVVVSPSVAIAFLVSTAPPPVVMTAVAMRDVSVGRVAIGHRRIGVRPLVRPAEPVGPPRAEVHGPVARSRTPGRSRSRRPPSGRQSTPPSSDRALEPCLRRRERSPQQRPGTDVSSISNSLVWVMLRNPLRPGPKPPNRTPDRRARPQRGPGTRSLTLEAKAEVKTCEASVKLLPAPVRCRGLEG